MGLFSGMARQAAALPPVQQAAATQAAPQQRRGLIGGRRTGPDWSSIAEFLMNGTDGVAGRPARLRAEEQLAITRQNEDRLRAQLSPADGSGGSGTGAVPDITQQMAALDDARLRDPAVAERFAPIVQQRRMSSLMAGRPIEEQLAVELNGDKAGESYASQFADVPLAAGTVRSRGGNIVAAAPRTERFDDRFGTYDPISRETTYSQPRGMTEDEVSRRITAERPTIANVAPGGTALAFGTDGGVVNSVVSEQARPMSDSDQAAVAKAEGNLARVNTAVTRAQSIAAQIDAGELNLGPMTNAISAGRNMIGQSDQNSLNYDSLLAWAREARNAVLQANTGVQTDADAVRELETIISGTRDERVVRAAINRYVSASQATADVLQRDVARRQGQDQSPSQPRASGGAPSRAALEAEARRRGLIQ